jgi:succinate-semialdehyde dehydrogenase / glutarate-semialdehyde dehydrogenase
MPRPPGPRPYRRSAEGLALDRKGARLAIATRFDGDTRATRSAIIKASEETPGAGVEMVRCFADAGLLSGVLNLVFGVPATISEYLIAKDEVRKISFTGSIPVGKHLATVAAKKMKRATMELGGHSPVVVFADADLEKSRLPRQLWAP